MENYTYSANIYVYGLGEKETVTPTSLVSSDAEPGLTVIRPRRLLEARASSNLKPRQRMTHRFQPRLWTLRRTRLGQGPVCVRVCACVCVFVRACVR